MRPVGLYEAVAFAARGIAEGDRQGGDDGMRSAALWRIAILAGIVILREVLCATGVIGRLTMQPPHSIATDLVAMLWSGALNKAIAKTLGNALLARPIPDYASLHPGYGHECAFTPAGRP
jgi:hypothetical protein